MSIWSVLIWIDIMLLFIYSLSVIVSACILYYRYNVKQQLLVDKDLMVLVIALTPILNTIYICMCIRCFIDKHFNKLMEH